MEANTELGEFLRSRRALLDPVELGVASYGRRRVPGLRREELAQLAGVSATYYTRLEQGSGSGASDGVLDALARALRLSDDERSHLHRIARPARERGTQESVAPLGRATAQVVASVHEVPVLALDRRNDVLAWNPLAHALLAGHLPYAAPDRPTSRPNTTRMLFLDAHTRELHEDWGSETLRAVAALRIVAGNHPGDPHLGSLVGELSMASERFAELWATHAVASCTEGAKRYRHPTVGLLELDFSVTTVADGTDHRLMILTARPGTPSEHALVLLARGLGER
ncbi:helix-turn-helix transcriptional regulator [Nocardioides plantarum]|uniref:Helix-turn-helix transcriptional regulator n=1 Tax=Nocardioides plantarum TaxID=29299 RepID=A0ABV5KD45_9ACTN|nr:helix-turn-helix transcriptional regulator [Nocardioides plantarum]